MEVSVKRCFSFSIIFNKKLLIRCFFKKFKLLLYSIKFYNDLIYEFSFGIFKSFCWNLYKIMIIKKLYNKNALKHQSWCKLIQSEAFDKFFKRWKVELLVHNENKSHFHSHIAAIHCWFIMSTFKFVNTSKMKASYK